MQGTEPEAELALSDDESLPWLESDDYEEEGGVDAAQIIGFVAILLAILGLLLGALWWFTNRTGSEEIVADGSTIEAPDGPYKEKPEDAGGKQFAGTGNVAPAVGEGQVRDGKIRDQAAEPDPDAKPAIATRSTSEQAASEPAKSAEAAPAEAKGVGVQVGAYGSRESAERGWQTLRSRTTALDGVSHRIEKGQADIGTVYRLQAVAGDLSAARALCSALKADGLACQVKR